MYLSGNITNSFGMNIVDQCLTLTIPGEIDDNIIDLIKNSLLQKVSESNLKGVVLDFSSLSIMDSYEFNEFKNLAKMIKLFGIDAIMVGLQPGIVSALVDLNVNTDDLLTFLNLEEGLNFLKRSTSKYSGEAAEEMDGDNDVEGAMPDEE